MLTCSDSCPKFVFKRELLVTLPLVSWAMLACGHVPINRADRSAAVRRLEAAARRADAAHGGDGRRLAMAPEGTRTAGERLGPFKRGPFHTSLRAAVPVVPIVIRGARRLWPPGNWVPRPGRIVLHFLSPIEPPAPAPAQEETARVDALLAACRAAFEQELARPSPPDPPMSLAHRLSTGLMRPLAFLVLVAAILVPRLLS
jgi:1-acyl-sn-glycerol-3-phosphate acyltransferase